MNGTLQLEVKIGRNCLLLKKGNTHLKLNSKEIEEYRIFTAVYFTTNYLSNCLSNCGLKKKRLRIETELSGDRLPLFLFFYIN